MSATTAFLKATWSERWLASQALLSLLANSALVHLLPYRFLEPRLRPADLTLRPNPTCTVECVVCAVSATARYVPGATCLVQALAGRTLLHRAGYPAVLRFGVARPAHAGLAAHAWLELEGRVLIGDSQPAAYRTLEPSPNTNRP